MGFVRNVKYFCGKRYFETDLFEVPDMGKRGKKMREKKALKQNKAKFYKKLTQIGRLGMKCTFVCFSDYFLTAHQAHLNHSVL